MRIVPAAVIMILVPFVAPALAEPAASNVGCPPQTAPLALDAGETTPATVPSGEQCWFTFTPVAGTTYSRIDLVGLSNDIDLFVKRGAQPTFSDYDCRSWRNGVEEERCEVENDGRTVHVMTNSVQGGGTYSLLATGIDISYCDLEYDDAPIVAGDTLDLIMTVDRWAACWFVHVGDGTTENVVITLDPAGGEDLELFTREGRRPTFWVYDCRSAFNGGSTETCSISNELGVRSHIMVLNDAMGGEFTLAASAVDPCSLGADDVPLPVGGEVVGEIGNVPDAGCRFLLLSDGASDAIRVQLASDAVDADLFLREGAPASYLDYDCASAQGGLAAEECLIPNVAGEAWSILAHRWDGAGAFSMRAIPVEFPVLPPNEPIAGTVEGSDVDYYKLHVPEGAAVVVFDLEVQDGDAEMTVRHGALPTAAEHDCRPEEVGARELCAFAAPPIGGLVDDVRPLQPGTYYLTVAGTPGLSQYTLTAHVA